MTRCASFRLVHRNEEPLFDHPVRLREKGGWKIEANCFRGFQANDQFKSARPLDRQVARTRTPQNFVGRSDRILHKLSIYGSVTQRGWGGAKRVQSKSTIVGRPLSTANCVTTDIAFRVKKDVSSRPPGFPSSISASAACT